jgi:6-phosphogluconolactonase
MVLVINELNNTLVSYRFDEASGRLNFVHGISTLPKGMEAPSTAADVRIHPNGSLAFVSNRGFDAITTIAIESTGRMEVASFVKTGGRVPRGIAIDPAGAFLMAAHQASDEVMAFSIDARRGNLETVARVSVPTSVCVQCL